MTERRHSVAGEVRPALHPGLLRRVRKSSVITGCVMGAPIATYFGLLPAGAWLLGIAWSLFNLSTTENVVRLVLTLEPRSKARIARSLAIKFVLLYGSAAALLALARIPALWWVAGFSWPLFVTVMKAAGRHYLRLDEPSPLSAGGRR